VDSHSRSEITDHVTASADGGPIISVRDVVKQYRVRHERGRTLKEIFLHQKIYQEKINALNNVSFDVGRGRTLGIIGSNGSGKSTILKLIAGTSRPTSGEIAVHGRVSALLELGAGFHPDFSGRENVYLDGAIMGLSRQLVDERFDEIVAFAGMEEFIDAPAKTYSSGMYLRLAFSVAVNVDPDIILIDEVFAVGDESFQRKCLDRMDRFKSEGKTIVFVSHNLGAVKSFCDEAVWLEKGRVKAQGAVEMVIDKYMWEVNKREEASLKAEQGVGEGGRWGTGRAEILSVEMVDDRGEPRHIFDTGQSINLRIAYRANETVLEPVLGIGIHRSDGVHVFGTNTTTLAHQPEKLAKGDYSTVADLKAVDLLPGSYLLSVALHNRANDETFDFHDRRFPFRVLQGPGGEIGLMHMQVDWKGWEPEAEK